MAGPWTQATVDSALGALDQLPWLKMYAIHSGVDDPELSDDSMPYVRVVTGVATIDYTVVTANGRALLYDVGSVPTFYTALAAVRDSTPSKDALVAGLASGTYTPTITGVLNVAASTARECQYMRVGNVVTVSGSVNVDPTALAVTQVDISLPVASNFAQRWNLGGTAAVYTGAVENPAQIEADPTNDRASMYYVPTNLSALEVMFHFTYRII